MQIAFARGAVITLRGPSVLEIESESCARLLVGNVSAQAETERSHGFTVRFADGVGGGPGDGVPSRHAAADGHSRVDVVAGAVEVRDGQRRRRAPPGRGAGDRRSSRASGR